MENNYEVAFSELIEMISQSRDDFVKHCESFNKAAGPVISLGDTQFISYETMVGTNERRAVRVIEQLAVSLFQARSYDSFSLYPIDPKYCRMEPREQEKMRPFQIIISENGKRHGIVFCVTEDAGNHYKRFTDGEYAVDSLRLVLMIDPDPEQYSISITQTNEFNKKCRIALERWTIRDFWERYFGAEEYEILVEHLNKFNEKVNGIIGFNTITIPTESALEKFRAKTGEMLRTYPYVKDIPQNIYQHQVDIWTKNFIDRGLWKAMVGTSNFAVSFITSEWNFNMYMLTENLDLAGVVAGYLKSVEQLLWAIIGLQTKQKFQIKAKYGGKIEFATADEEIIDSTLGSLEQVLKENAWMFDVNNFAKRHIIDAIDDWRQKHRNGYFHKHNLQTKSKVEEIRKQTIQLYFLILGGCKIKDEDFVKLGIQ